MYYSGAEIIDIALRIEENGHAFYTEGALHITDNEEIKKLFEALAKKEVKHIAVFKHLGEGFEDEQNTTPFEGVEAYISYVADTHIFQKKGAGKELASKISSSRNALEIAYKFEIESVYFYEELQKHTQKRAQKLIEQIIEEEKEHAKEIKQFLE